MTTPYLELKERERELANALEHMINTYGGIAFAVGNGMNPRDADWEKADKVLHNARKVLGYSWLPKILIRKDDRERFIKNDDGTYTMEMQKELMPTTFYNYTYERLMSTGKFEHG